MNFKIYKDCFLNLENYLLENFIQDSNSLNIKKTVHVQAEINSNLNIEETKWLQFIADNNSKCYCRICRSSK